MNTEIPMRPCPRCGSVDAIRIAYGYPGPEMSAAANHGEIRLGGCVVGPESPDYECRRCHSALPWVRPRDAAHVDTGGVEWTTLEQPDETDKRRRSVSSAPAAPR